MFAADEFEKIQNHGRTQNGRALMLGVILLSKLTATILFQKCLFVPVHLLPGSYAQ